MDAETKWLRKPTSKKLQPLHSTEPAPQASDQPIRIFTHQELARANGTDGKPALIAVGGKVYDLSTCKMWKKATHMNLFEPGRDLTLEIRMAPHGLRVLEMLEQVGMLAQQQAAVAPADVEPGFLQKLLSRRHLHPMTVHFPIAMTFVAGLFVAAHIVFQTQHFELVALYCLVIATGSTPVAVMAGVMSWMHNYQTVWTPIWREKVLLSCILVVIQISALLIRAVFVGNLQARSPAF